MYSTVPPKIIYSFLVFDFGFYDGLGASAEIRNFYFHLLSYHKNSVYILDPDHFDTVDTFNITLSRASALVSLGYLFPCFTTYN